MRTLRIVLDSNVVVSAFLFGGPPGYVYGHVLAGLVQCFVSVAVLDEIRDVLQRPKFGLSTAQALSFVEELRDVCHVVTPIAKVRVVGGDPDDDAILECALAANADVVVSGDAHLLRLGQWRGIRVLSPAEFLHERNCGQIGQLN